MKKAKFMPVLLAVLMLASLLLAGCPAPSSASPTAVAQWAQTTTSGTNESYFNSVTVDTSGNIYAAGIIDGNASFGFGNGVTATGAYSSGLNIVLGKYR